MRAICLPGNSGHRQKKCPGYGTGAGKNQDREFGEHLTKLCFDKIDKIAYNYVLKIIIKPM
jgi:hypothetical protein